MTDLNPEPSSAAQRANLGAALALTSNRRSWHALRPTRLWVGLLLSPIVPALISAPTFWLVFFERVSLTLAHVDRFLSIYLSIAEAWALVIGATGVFGVARWRGAIGRRGCLLLGAIGAFTFPFVVVFALDIYELVVRGTADGLDFSLIPRLLVLSVAALPFGLFGGWIFWRIAIRPAASMVPNVARVFD